MSAGEFQQQCLFTILVISYQPGVQLILFFFRHVHNFEGIISMLLDGVVITFLQGFDIGV
jgi:hypothetical protein